MKKYQLMAPGPTPVPSEALLAMAQPMIHHRTPQYEALFAEVRARFSEDETLELTWVIAEFIALGKVIHVLGLPYGAVEPITPSP